MVPFSPVDEPDIRSGYSLLTVGQVRATHEQIARRSQQEVFAVIGGATQSVKSPTLVHLDTPRNMISCPCLVCAWALLFAGSVPWIRITGNWGEPCSYP